MAGMGREHLTLEEMSYLLDGQNELTTLVDGLVHLLVCPRCWERFRKRYPERSRFLFLESFGTEAPPRSISPDRLRDGLQAVLRDVQESGKALKELLSHPSARRTLLVRNSTRFQTIGLAGQLLEEARLTWDEDPWQALELVELGLLVLRRIPKTHQIVGQLNDLMARAFAYRGNCHRIVSKLQVACRDFERARIYLAQGKGWPLSEALVDEYEVSLCRDHCRFEEGAKLARRARQVYQDVGDLQGEARLMILEAMNLRSAGDQASACRKLQTLLATFQPEEIGWRHVLYAKHNLATYLTELGRVDEAREMLPELYNLYRSLGERFMVIRLCWLEAMILERVGEVDAAAERYVKVRDFFAERRISYDVALVSLDLAALYLDSGRTVAAKELAASLVPLFEAHQIHREASMALALFCRAVKQEEATVALAHDVAGFLKRARGRPDLRYEPASDCGSG